MKTGDFVEALEDIIDEDFGKVARKGEIGQVAECDPEEYLVPVKWQSGAVVSCAPEIDVVKFSGLKVVA